MSDIKVKAILFKGKTYKNDESPIMLRLTKDRKSIYLSLDYTAKPSQWNDQQSCLYNSVPRLTQKQKDSLSNEELRAIQKEYKAIEVHSNHNKINSVITLKLGEIQGIIDTQKVLKRIITLKSIKEKYNSNSSDSDQSFIQYALKKQNEELISGKVRTYKRYKTIIQKLRDYLNGKDLAFLDFNHEFLVQYEAHLKNTLKNKTNTIHTNIKTLRAILYKAIKQGHFDQAKNPFFTYSLKEDRKTKKEKLTIKEIIAIKNLKLEQGSKQYHARNCFLFSFYNAGIRVGDLIQLKWENITKNGRIEYKMDKQGQEKSIKLRPEALAILNQYKPSKPNKEAFIFPFLPTSANKLEEMDRYNLLSSKTSLINQALKDIGKKAKIEKKISTHVARHTFSDIARQKEVNVYDISKALGHSSIKQTESYLKNFDESSLDKAMDKVYDSI